MMELGAKLVMVPLWKNLAPSKGEKWAQMGSTTEKRCKNMNKYEKNSKPMVSVGRCYGQRVDVEVRLLVKMF